MFKKIILLTLLSGLVNASPLIGDSSTIFKKAEPAIVLIGNEEGFGSGVLISSKGLIITNQHVVNSPLPLTVKAKVLVGGEYVEKEYKDIKVLKVHKAYDLALVKIKDKVRFKYLPIKNSNKATTGSKAFVIGNPDVGNGEALRNSITEGLVSSNERKIENLKYLQISAAINPGNSGGAALDKKGNLIGIVTFKALQADSIGFAVPVTEIANKDFILPENKKSNITKAKELEAKGSEFFDKAQMARDENLKKFLYAVAGYYYRMSLAEAPSNASPYHNVGLMYYKLEKVKAAEAYFKKALELDPNSVNTLHTLGIIYVKDNKVDEAQKLWVKGAFLKGPGAGSCAENASITAFNKKDYITAAYFANLAMKHDKSYNVKKRNDLLNQASQHISEYSLNKIQSKDKPESFSLADLKELKKVDKSKKASEIAQRKKEKMEQIKQAEGFKKKLKELIEANKNAPDEWVNKKIPGTVTDMIPVFGGAYIAITVKDLKKLIIYDTLTAKIIKYFPIQSTNCLIGKIGSSIKVPVK